jgi:hypothetical protein
MIACDVGIHHRAVYNVNMKDDKPLISSRSPSYERARHEREHPSSPGDDAVIAVLGHLVELEHDAARALVAAGEDPTNHLLRARGLGEVIDDLGGSPPRPEESRELLRNGAEEVRRSGDVAATLAAMRDELSDAYDEAARDPVLNDAQHDALMRMR